MEGILSVAVDIVQIQTNFLSRSKSRLSIRNWAEGLVVKLLEVKHGHGSWSVAVPECGSAQYQIRSFSIWL